MFSECNAQHVQIQTTRKIHIVILIPLPPKTFHSSCESVVDDSVTLCALIVIREPQSERPRIPPVQRFCFFYCGECFVRRCVDTSSP